MKVSDTFKSITMNPEIFETVNLDSESSIYITYPIPIFNFSHEEFLSIWALHPERYHKLKMYGQEIDTPRWQQAFGKNYRYTGSQNNALPIPPILQLFLNWSKKNIDERLNGLLLNWYDGQKGHYIGAHKDDTRDLIPESPIVTISLGEERIFRMRPYQQSGFKNITVRNAEVIVIPWETNQSWTHEVPSFQKYKGKRVSITLRAYS